MGINIETLLKIVDFFMGLFRGLMDTGLLEGLM